MATPAVRDISISCDLNSLPRVVSVPGSLFTGDMLANIKSTLAMFRGYVYPFTAS